MDIAFTPENRQAIASLLEQYPDSRACVMPVLDLAQAQFGYLSDDVLALVATTLSVPPELVLNTATFYSMYSPRPVGRFHLQVCRNVACYLRGADDILETLRTELGIGLGETTEDGLFTLSAVECLASCGTAPAMQVNEEFHEELTSEKVRNLVARLRAEVA